MTWQTIGDGLSNEPFAILDEGISLAKYCNIDLSITNKDLNGIAISDPQECQSYIDKVLKANRGTVAYGGYLERRNLYKLSDRFYGGETRNIHLGIDFWCKAGTKVRVPMDGYVHSFANNADIGNYGPTIILRHQINQTVRYTLYGHLSLSSLVGLYENKAFKKGEVLGFLGTPDINVNYAPHLHFQLINDMGDYSGDYPGVCHLKDLDFYQKNCPDPNLLLKI
ncbi:MAG: peptidoglycan DD-metalloendopeptidase family protein [Croceitalea sp.]|nr:peptidoglycan DD-metalloendopeptidase family protein [Croceitalea sp.]